MSGWENGAAPGSRQPHPDCGSCSLPLSLGSRWVTYRRRIYTEEKAKVVGAVWGTEFIQLLAVLYQDDMKKRINFTRMIWSKGWIHPILQIVLVQNSYPARNWINCSHDLFLLFWINPSSMVSHICSKNTTDEPEDDWQRKVVFVSAETMCVDGVTSPHPSVCADAELPASSFTFPILHTLYEKGKGGM